MLGDAPAVAERIGYLPVPLTPEDVLQRLADLAAAIDGPLPDGVGVIGGEVRTILR